MMLGTGVELSRAVELVIDDLQTVRTRYVSELPTEGADVVATYLLANQGLIEKSLESVYKGLTKEERIELYDTHSELDYDGAMDDWHAMALHTVVGVAKNYWQGLMTIKEDHINVLVRGLGYAKYCTSSVHRVRLFLHPIDQYLS